MEATLTLESYKIQVNNYEIRRETFEGRAHIVVPVIMMREGVHSGSHGPMFHREEELSKYEGAWNGIPVTLSHPQDEDGTNVSANSPAVLEATTVGRIFNTHYNDGLRAEAWLDVEKLREISPEALSQIENGNPMDVSVGVFSDSDPTEGEWQGETYETVARNYRPDHLALLPGETGACSWDDGCGIRANKGGGNMEDLLKNFKSLNQEGYAVVPISNAQGYRELVQSLQSQLDAMDTNDRVHYLQEVYDDHFVYAVRTRGGTETLYKRDYSANEGAVTFGGDPPAEVRRKVEYVTMKERVRSNVKTNTETMSDKNDNLCCEAKVDALIAHKLTSFKAEDKEWLMGLKEEQISKLSPVEPEKPAVNKTEEPQVNKEEVIDAFKAGLTSIDDYVALMPEEMKAQVNNGVTLYTEQRDSRINGILAHASNNFSKEKLETMDDELLESIFKSVTPADYSGQGHTPDTNAAGEETEVLLPAGVKVNGQKKED